METDGAAKGRAAPGVDRDATALGRRMAASKQGYRFQFTGSTGSIRRGKNEELLHDMGKKADSRHPSSRA